MSEDPAPYQGFFPAVAWVSPAVCSLFITLAGASFLLEPYLPRRYDSITRRISGPGAILILAVHLFMGWLAVRVSRRGHGSGPK